jgi:hypothetical protein
LARRPFGHCVGTVLLASCLTWVVLEKALRRPEQGRRYGLVVLAAGLTHQLRDSIRRGMWFCPLGSLPPTPYLLYVVMIAVAPFGLRVLLHYLLRSGARTPYTPYQAVPIIDNGIEMIV